MTRRTVNPTATPTTGFRVTGSFRPTVPTARGFLPRTSGWGTTTTSSILRATPASRRCSSAARASPSWGVALGVGVAACVDATPYTGVTFWAKSTSGTALPVKFDLGTYDIVSSANGGGCTGTCAGRYETSLTIPTEWKQIQIPFCAFAPVMTTIPVAKNKITGLTFLIPGKVTYQFYIDDISFY